MSVIKQNLALSNYFNKIKSELKDKLFIKRLKRKMLIDQLGLKKVTIRYGLQQQFQSPPWSNHLNLFNLSTSPNFWIAPMNAQSLQDKF